MRSLSESCGWTAGGWRGLGLDAKMSEEDILSKEIAGLDPTHQEMCRLIASGVAPGKAYCMVMRQMNPRTGINMIWKVLKRPEVKECLAQERARAREASKLDPSMVINYHLENATTGPGEIDENSPLAQEVQEIHTTRPDGTVVIARKTKKVSTMASLRELAALGGMYPKEAQDQVQNRDILEFLRALRRPGIPMSPTAIEQPTIEMLPSAEPEPAEPITRDVFEPATEPEDPDELEDE